MTSAPTTADEVKPEDAAREAAPPAAKGDSSEKRHPFTVQLAPTVMRRARMLASLKGTTVSRMVEADLVKRIASELKALIEGLDKSGE